jgi:hypothetical protein
MVKSENFCLASINGPTPMLDIGKEGRNTIHFVYVAITWHVTCKLTYKIHAMHAATLPVRVGLG